ncbi:hypothetical protein Tco_0518195 [Tanacetum coccineum]
MRGYELTLSKDPNQSSQSSAKNIESKDSYVSNLDEPTLLVTPLSDANEDECFDPRGEIDEIDAFLDMDISTDIENNYHDSEGDIIYLKSLLINDTIPNLPPEIPSGESKVHIEVLSVLWGNRLSIPDGSLSLSRTPDVSVFKKVKGIPEVEIRLLARSVKTPDVSVV